MKRINVVNWMTKIPDIVGGEQVGLKDGKEENIIDVLNILIAGKKPEDMPRGLDNFRLLHRLSKAFDKAKKSKMLLLQVGDYEFLKKTIDKDVFGMWGMNDNISNAIEDFLDAKTCDEKGKFTKEDPKKEEK